MEGRKLLSTCTCEDLLESVARRWGWRYAVLFTALSLSSLSGPLVIYTTVFAGIDPEAGDNWTCVTEKCTALLSNPNITTELIVPCTTIVGEDGVEEFVLSPSDYTWDLERTSFSAEFGLFCEGGDRAARKTLLTSIYFVGALAGLLCGGYLFDNIGRKRTAIIGNVIAVSITVAGYFCHSYYFLLVIRIVQGFGFFLVGTGMFVLTVEILPARYRNYINGWAQCLWAVGYGVAAANGYFVKDWNQMFLVAAIISFITQLPVFFAIESPRYYLIKGDVDAAKDSLKRLGDLNGIDLDLENTTITDGGKDREQSFKQQLVEFRRYPILLVETLLCMFLWFFVGLSYYGFNFGWGSILPDRYIGYLMAMVGELIAYIGLVPAISKLGRRRALMIAFLGAAVCYLVAIPDVALTSGENPWTLESVASLVGVVFISASFSGIYLWTGEIAPTSHRGFVFCMSSSAGRIGSFLGPFIVNNLSEITHKAVPLATLSALSLVAFLACFSLVETDDKGIASTAEEVVSRRKQYSYRI